MAIHKDLPTSELHEPKGAATASSGEVYVADGSASGVFKKLEASNVSLLDADGYFTANNIEAAIKELMDKLPQGWGYYKDSGVSAQTINTTAAKLNINKLGASTDESYLPYSIRGSGTLWNASSSKITPINEGDSYELRIDLPVTAKSGTPSELVIQFDIGGGATPSNVIAEKRLSIDASPSYILSDGFPVFCLSTFLTNGGQIFLSVDSGSIDITGAGLFITRISNGAL